jgi:hypothetical protein
MIWHIATTPYRLDANGLPPWSEHESWAREQPYPVRPR